MKISVITGEILKKSLDYSNCDSPFACDIHISIKSLLYGLQGFSGDKVICDWIYALLNEEGEVRGLIKSVLGGYVVFLKEVDRKSLDGLADFYLFHDRKSFYSSEDVIMPLKNLIGGKLSEKIIMKAIGEGNEEEETTSFSNLGKAYELLEEVFLDDCPKELVENWQYNMFRKLKTGGKAYVKLEQDGENSYCVACGFIDGVNDESFLLSSLAVKKENRKKDEGSKAVKALVSNCKKGKSVYAFLLNDDLTEFYDKNGFSYFGKRLELKP